MLSHFRQWLAPPVFEADEDRTRKASLLNTVVIASIVATIVIIGGGLLGTSFRRVVYTALGMTLITLIGLRWLLGRGRIGLASAGCSLALSFFTALALAG